MKRLLIGGALVLIALAVVAHLIASQLSLENLRPRIEARLSDVVGLAVKIDGELSLELLPEIHIQLGDLRVANLPGRASEDLLRVGLVQLDLELRPLLRRSIAIESVEFHDAELRIEPREDGAWSLNPDPEKLYQSDESASKDEPVQIRLQDLAAHNLTVFYDRAGSDHVTTAVIDRLEIATDDLDSPVDVSAEGQLEGGEFWLEAAIGSIRELLQPTRPFPVSLDAEFLATRVQLEGTLEDPTGFGGVKLDVAAQIADLAALNRDPDRKLPPLGRVTLTGTLQDPDGVLGVRDLELRTKSGGKLELVVTGSVDDLVQVAGVDVRVSVETKDADIFEAFADVAMPQSPLRADLELSDHDGSLGIEGSADTEGGPFDLDLEGVFDDLRQLRELDVRVQLDSATLRSIPDSFGFDSPIPLPTLGPVKASGRIIDTDGVFGVSDLQVQVGDLSGPRAKLTGSIVDLQEMTGLELEVELQAPSAQRAAEFFDLTIPDLGALVATATLSDSDGTLGVEYGFVRVGKPEEFGISVKGAFEDMRELNEVALDLEVSARTLSILGELAEIELPPVGPLAFRGTLRGSDEELRSKGDGLIGQTYFDGEWVARFPKDQRPSLWARFKSPHLFVADLGITPEIERPELPPEADFDAAAWWRGDQPLDLEPLRLIDLDIALRADQVTGRNRLQLDELELALVLDEGKLNVTDFGAEFEGGQLKGTLEVDARFAEPSFALGLEAFNVDLTPLFSQLEENSGNVGLLDLSIELTAEGSHGPQLAESLDGFAGAMLREGSIVTRYSRAFSLNLLRVSVPEFLNRNNTDRAPPVHCLIALFDLESGIADARNLYLEGAKITITGAGQIDLPGDEIDLRLTPHLHEPGLVSVAATVDVSGPIGDPNIRAVRRSLGASAARALFRNAMRPFRAAESVARRDSTELLEVDQPCETMAAHRRQQQETAEVEPIEPILVPANPAPTP